MSRRHNFDISRTESVLIRLEELVRANSGDDSFSEVFKILLVKLYTEKNNKLLDYSYPDKLLSYFNLTLGYIQKYWPNLLDSNEYETKLSPSHLQICFREISEVVLYDENLESLDIFFEYLVSKSSKGEKGQYFTPRYVIDCCVKMLELKPSDKILDPACGSGGFLFHSLMELKGNTVFPNNIWGFDFDPKAIKVAKTLLTICGGSPNNIYNINSLLKPTGKLDLISPQKDNTSITIEDILRTTTKKFKGFDAILTNPPFAGEIKEGSVIASYDLAKKGRRNERDVLFIERCVELLRPGGKLAIVLPHNKIGGKSYGYVRGWLLSNMRIVSVLSLPRSTFLPHTHQKAEIIFAIKREKPIKISSAVEEEILFLVSECNAKDSKGNLNYKNGSSPSQSAWDKVDHDFDEVLQDFKSFIKKTNIEW